MNSFLDKDERKKKFYFKFLSFMYSSYFKISFLDRREELIGIIQKDLILKSFYERKIYDNKDQLEISKKDLEFNINSIFQKLLTKQYNSEENLFKLCDYFQKFDNKEIKKNLPPIF